MRMRRFLFRLQARSTSSRHRWVPNLTTLPTLPERVHLTVLVYGEEDTNPWIQDFATSDGQGGCNIFFLIFIVFSYMASNEYLPTYVFRLLNSELTLLYKHIDIICRIVSA